MAAVQGRQTTFKSFPDRVPVIWLRRNAPETCLPLNPNIPLAQAGAPRDKAFELVATFQHVKLLPSAQAGAVPAPDSGASVRPPGAFTVSSCSWAGFRLLCNSTASWGKCPSCGRTVHGDAHERLCSCAAMPAEQTLLCIVVHSLLCRHRSARI